MGFTAIPATSTNLFRRTMRPTISSPSSCGGVDLLKRVNCPSKRQACELEMSFMIFIGAEFLNQHRKRPKHTIHEDILSRIDLGREFLLNG